MKSLLISALLASSIMGASLTDEAKNAGLKPIPANQKAIEKLTSNSKNPTTAAKVELGKMLYFEPRLSKSGLISCNTCHNLATGGSDGMASAIGHKWTSNPHHLSSPTVYNAVFYSQQFWDGRSPHLEDQAQGPIQAGPEMAAPKEFVEGVVNSIPAYVTAFKKAYGKEVKIDFAKVADTIAVFERTLVTPSRYDDFLNGKKNALSKAEQKGLKTFIDKGCATCHNDIALGGTMQAFGAVAPYKHMNVGDFKGDKNGMVRVPTLRNVTETAPYFHNGQIATLPEAIKEMGRIQLGVDLSDKETEEIETFLKALEGKKPTVVYPMLPASTTKTPKVDVVNN
ncbi:cytochrome-c peroxidase [Sulfuricurvum sp. RIFCSPLOWO2_12_FULL_43_24]|uniref:cytochrome-c peroxidase n=1 Tax=Sulfuricurvum sp. RIFCSPLOWO2_12_FULL_43_24 TaxID=1802247 RepID=UPI0008B89452|nr:cytochrome-c peroxidase [Sulfuricurvum sp. RIFCSPLOWO2_12_FULL_43_24]OHD85602.1 MAG: cytochrome C biogenesis protein CcsA [Sulfuricurvum sp. RIFCSPLOWO2_02_FULL_43_45]OHD89776.1 MAG: cytochrome C biogenesis protein CcsA [Sulfuricurvum sp. RIFCSPLOWO2_12_FULL_43_24]